MHQPAACDDAELHGFVDGRLDPARAAAVADSLAADPEARARLDGWKRQNDTLRTMFAAVLFEPVPVRLLPVTVKSHGTERPAAVPGRQGLAGVVVSTAFGMGLIGFALGALAGSATDGFRLMPFGLPGRPVPEVSAQGTDFARRAAETHQTYLGDPSRAVEIAGTEEPRLLRWLQHRVAATLRIPDLRARGWSLVGGRVVPGSAGPAAFLVYGSGADRLGLYVARGREPAGGSLASIEGPASATAVAAWTDGPLGYALTSSHPGDWLDRNAPVLRDIIQGRTSADDSVP